MFLKTCHYLLTRDDQEASAKLREEIRWLVAQCGIANLPKLRLNLYRFDRGVVIMMDEENRIL